MTSTSPPQPDPTVFEHLQSWILDGSLSPGQRLPVRDIARGLGVSTMPVRGALARLAEIGLVSHEKNKGAVVSRLSLDDLKDFYGLRRLLEPASIQIGVECLTPARLARVRATMDTLRQAVGDSDLIQVLDIDEDLLALIHAAAGNRQIARVIRSTWTRIRPYKLLFTTTAQADAGERILSENARLIEAAEAHDGQAAKQIMTQSLDNAELQLVDFLRSHEVGAPGTSSTVSMARGESLASIIAGLRTAAQEVTRPSRQ